MKTGDEVVSTQRKKEKPRQQKAGKCGADGNVSMWVEGPRDGRGRPEPGLGVLPMKRANNWSHKGRAPAAIGEGSRGPA